MATEKTRDGDLKYLRQRRGRWLVQVRVPDDLQALYPSKRNIERYLGTSSLPEARRLRHAAVADIFAMFDRARKKVPLTDEERKTEGAAEAHKVWEWLKANPNDGAYRLQEHYLENFIGPPTLDGEELTEELDLTELEPRARAIIERIGATVTDASVKAMSEELVNAAFHAHGVWRHGGTPPPPARHVRRSVAPSDALTFSQAGERYLAERQRDPRARLTAQTAAQSRATFRLFADHTNDAAVTTITRADAIDFLDVVGRLHPHYGRRPGAAKLKLAELLKKFPATDGSGLANRTLNRHQSTLKRFFKWAADRELYSGANPFAELSRPKARLSAVTYLPFDVEELNRLFAGQKFSAKPTKHDLASAWPWLMAIALFSGLRQGEIAELDAEDVKARGGIHFFDITEAKSEAGVRLVPVHPQLVKLGLLDYVKAIKSGPLFPGLTPAGHDKKRAHVVAKRFPAFRRDRGVRRKRVVFHSFRKCFVRALETAKIDRDRAAQVVGHERGFTFRIYNPDGVNLPALRKVVEAVKYPGLKLR